MNSLSKVIVLFAVLGIIGAGLFFFPGSPLNYKTLIVVQTQQEAAPAEAEAEAPAEQEGQEQTTNE